MGLSVLTNEAVAVIISDIHYNLLNLDVADFALYSTIDYANKNGLPLIIAGDLHDTKANLRAECINAMIRTLKTATVPVYLIIGNHDLINEKGREHALAFLEPYCHIIDDNKFLPALNIHAIAYKSSNEEFVETVKQASPLTTIICHQGLQGAFMGEYAQDRSSVPPSDLVNRYFISGHYHRHQVLKLERGLFTYIGSPYTTSFSEHADGQKGFLVLNRDGSYTRIPLYLRKHIIIDTNANTIFNPTPAIHPHDRLWIKLRGSKSELSNIDKQKLGNILLGHDNFRLDLIPDEADTKVATHKSENPSDLFDGMIDLLNDTDTHKSKLKALWRRVVNEDK